MIQQIIQLIVLFFVIFDPPASLFVFTIATKKVKEEEKKKTGILAVSLAAGICVLVLIFGEGLLKLFNTTLDDFRVAGGIILILLGIKMALGRPLVDVDKMKDKSARAIASVIATPLLTGPAAITTIIVSTKDYGYFITSAALAIVLGVTALLFIHSTNAMKKVSRTTVQLLSTSLGLITISWGVRFIRIGFGI
ncbi:MarC family protein [Candidatus Woesearchaeota archaeon]|nr:MarC family protein [Candidatus Woesearchaeota archaeon]HIH38122.1 MarC family protein [Candidatus Woesearchaeota archaeon]HIH49571.1 MarC family protein [Candidatus Woesearchaeota archaeon]HIJ04381.1 MarC family protein [Candidatus Woesearchaeota archaeon]